MENTYKYTIIVIVTIGIVYMLVNDYLIYKRLNKVADKLINDKDMPYDEKIINLCWLSQNCNRFSVRSILWSRKYNNIETKIKDYLTESCKESGNEKKFRQDTLKGELP